MTAVPGRFSRYRQRAFEPLPRQQLSAALEAEGSRFLTVAKRGQQDDAPIWEFERVMVRSRLFLVDLSKDCDCLTNGQFSSSGRGQSYLFGKGKFCRVPALGGPVSLLSGKLSDRSC